MTFNEMNLSVDLHNKTATIAYQKTPNQGFISINGMPFHDSGSSTDEEKKHKVRLATRRFLEELLHHLPT